MKRKEGIKEGRKEERKEVKEERKRGRREKIIMKMKEIKKEIDTLQYI